MTFGETDIIVIYEAPDAISSAALAMTLGASGAFSSIKTAALLTTADGIKAQLRPGQPTNHPRRGETHAGGR
jgi:uncharacterized protein with GYD domain